MIPIITQTYEVPPVDRREILRYAGVRGEAPEIEALLQACLNETQDKLCYRVCYGEFPVSFDGQTVDLGFAQAASVALRERLLGCDRIILFAATVGIEMDRLIAKYAKLSPSRAVVLQAIGAERIEALCDVFCQDIERRVQKQGRTSRSRFSPGYGDLSLQIQRDVLRVLQAPSRIGLTLSERFLMSPTKSVTAIVGICKQS